MRTLPGLLLLTACGATTPQQLTAHHDASYEDIDTFVPAPTPDAGNPMPMPMPMPDAGTLPPPMFSDGGMYATPSTPDQVFCGSTMCDATSQMCCADAEGGPACASASQGCSGHIVFHCDGPDDCGASASACCVVPEMVDGGLHITTACLADCHMAAFQLCHTASDCPSDRPACCRGADFPLGHCLELSGAPAGDVCDIP